MFCTPQQAEQLLRDSEKALPFNATVYQALGFLPDQLRLNFAINHELNHLSKLIKRLKHLRPEPDVHLTEFFLAAIRLAALVDIAPRQLAEHNEADCRVLGRTYVRLWEETSEWIHELHGLAEAFDHVDPKPDIYKALRPIALKVCGAALVMASEHQIYPAHLRDFLAQRALMAAK